MPNLLRTSPASVICPFTPFLVPRLLRTTAPRATLLERRSLCAPTVRQLSYAAKHKGKAKEGGSYLAIQNRRKHRRPEPVNHPSAPLVQQLRTACDARDIKTLMDLYPNVVALGALDNHDTRRIAQALHTHARYLKPGDTRLRDVFSFVEQLVLDIQMGNLPPHPYAHVHLLGIYKDCGRYEEGYTFWQWLVQKDGTFVSSAVYGAAIELLAHGRKFSLTDLERLYVDALKRFPGTFAEYHLSPHAIVPDRSQPIAIMDLPVLLLQGILTARMRFRDWNNSYLALDTALRLFPAQLTPRFFELFMLERSVPEAYTVFLIACRAGIVFKPNHLTVLINKLRSAMAASTSLSDRTMTLRAIANAIYAYLEAGGTLESLHVGAFVRVFDQLLPEKAAGVDYEGEKAVLRNTIVKTAHDIVTTLIQAGMPASEHIFIALIHLAGQLRVPDLLAVSLQDVKTARIDIGAIGDRTVVTSAGYLQNRALIEEYWADLALQSKTEGRPIDYETWVTFAKACRRAQHFDYFTQQLDKFDHSLSVPMKQKVTYLMDTKEFPPPDGSVEMMESAAFNAEMEALKGQVKSIAAVTMAGQPLDLRKTPFYMFIDPNRTPLGLASDLRIIYDELTVDPHQPPLPEESTRPAALSSTGIPLDELRFQNWAALVELMDEAEQFEKERRAHVQSNRHRQTFRIPQSPAVRLRRPARESSSLPLPLDQLRTRVKLLRTPTIRDVDPDKAEEPPMGRRPSMFAARR